jgi:hypothetical protein
VGAVEKNKLSYSEYQRLCADACSGFAPSGSRVADEETLMLRICEKVFSYLGEDMDSISLKGTSNHHTYKLKLQQLVSQRQDEWFDTLETPGRFINEALNKAYG